MNNDLMPKVIEYFNSQSPSDRAVSSSDVYIITMHHMLEEGNGQIVPGDARHSELAESGIYEGTQVFLWVGERGTNLTATIDSFLQISGPPLTKQSVALHQIATYNPNEYGLSEVLDAEWVSNRLMNNGTTYDFANTINMFALGGAGNEHEIWMTNPIYVSMPPESLSDPIPLSQYLMRIRPLYSMTQFISHMPTIDSALHLDPTYNRVLLAPFKSGVPLVFGTTTDAQVSYNPTHPNSALSEFPLVFELYWVQYPSDMSYELGNGEVLLLRVRVDGASPNSAPTVEVPPAYFPSTEAKSGAKGQYFWILQNTHQLGTISLHDFSITVNTPMFNQYSDSIIQTAPF